MAIEDVNGVEGQSVENAGKEGDGSQTEVAHETQAEKEAREKREAHEREFRAKKRRLIPPFVMLLAGAVTSITMRVLHYDMKSTLIILLCVLLGFYIAGCLAKHMLDQFESQIEQAGMDEGEVIEKELTGESMSGKV